VSGKDQFDRDGFLVVPDLLPMAACDGLAAELTGWLTLQQQSAPKARGGLRNVLRLCRRTNSTAASESFTAIVSDLIGGAAFPVRAILFDKTEDANWGVPWHQDLAIAVAARIDTEGFGPWSSKAGVVHVQPPPQILANMVTLRLHLDDGTVDNGALRVVPGSHLEGELSAEGMAHWIKHHAAVTCEIAKGGALLMRPLLLHASSPAKNPSHRRVLHVEYAATELPNGLKWSERI
jgi:ectoine hydroxylase-related dioxygenase (phytanoyl-CoA dioxygenase family)